MTDKKTIRIRYQPEDGYVGDRWQYLKVDREEWDSMDEEERCEYVAEMIAEHASWRWEVEP